ncbi:zinc-binding dehydrogenase [Enterococcus sp. 669A]|uniref:Zinc-binding dehydrogenase n=1 Tax=Candidatus Enterococcus moelleringii TaxID=2815325 RepID=A0ABS3L5B9_9ENTE|nr:zinc-binding dehydrogenase [Enterococcus sp. 669A]
MFDPEKDQIDETFDVIIECVGRPNTQEQAIQMAARGGQILMFGVGDPDTNIQVNAYDVYFKELIIKGAFINPHVMEDAISILDHHVIDVEKLITHELALDEVEAVLSGENKEKITKAVVKIS